MIVTHPDGTVRRTSITDCTGYRAKKIEMESVDFAYMAALCERNPEGLYKVLRQLEYRMDRENASAFDKALIGGKVST